MPSTRPRVLEVKPTVEPPPRPGRKGFGVQVMFSDHQPAPSSTAQDAVGAKDKVMTGDGGVREQKHQAERLRTALDEINRLQQDEADLTEPLPSAPPFASIWAIRETAEHRELDLGHEPPPPPPPPVAHHPDDVENQNRVLQVLDEVLAPSENLYGPRDEDDGYDEVGTSDDADPADFPVRGPRYEEFADEDEEEEDEALRCCGCGGANARRDRDPDVDCEKQEQQTGALKRRRALRDSGGGCCGWVQDADGVGPMARPRKSRDVLCMALFVLCWLVWVVLVWTMVTDGCPDKCNDPRRLIYGADSVSNELCGFGSQAYRSKIFFPYPENPVARRMCVSRCPDGLSDNLRVARALGLIERSASGDPERAGEESAGALVGAEGQMPNCFLSKERPCFYPSYPTAEFLGRCVPVVPENLTAAQVMGFPRNGTAYLLASHFIASPAGLLGDAVGELAQNWRVILAFTACGLLVGLVWLLLLRFAAVCFIMGLMLLLQTGLVGVTLLAWDKTQRTQLFASIPGVSSALASISLSGSVAHTVAILLSVITLVTFLLFLVMASRILVAVRLIQEAARAVSDMKSILLVPLSNVPLLLALALWVGSGSLLLASAGDFDSVLGAYSYGVSSVLTHGNKCAERVLDANPMAAATTVDVPVWGGRAGEVRSVERAVAHNISLAEAERLCVVYQDPERAVMGWEIRVAAKLARYTPPTNATDAEVKAVDVGDILSGDYGAWNAKVNTSLESWLMGDFRHDLPFTVSDYYHYYWLYHLLLSLWTYAFTTTGAVMIIAGAVGHWYFRTEEMALRGWPVVRSTLRLICFQLGTLAFGSLIVALVWMLRLLVQWAAKKVRQLRAFPVAGSLLCIMECCMACLERFVTFINRSTVIVAAFTGKGYCASSRKAGALIMANVLRIAAVSMASRLVLFLGQVFVCAASTAGAWWWLTYAQPRMEGDRAVLGPDKPPVFSLIAVAFGSWLLARIVLGVYWVVIDSVMMCFFYDSEKANPLPCTNVIEGRWRSRRILDDRDNGLDSQAREEELFESEIERIRRAQEARKRDV